jgi:hypothetical protein
MGRQFDSAGRCVKQDPMQGGAGDQSVVSKFNMFSDYNASVVQRFFEETTSLVNNKKSYSGGKLVVDAASPSGYSQWDSLESAMVSADISTNEGAVYSFDQGTPIQRNVPIYSIVFTASVASVVELV